MFYSHEVLTSRKYDVASSGSSRFASPSLTAVPPTSRLVAILSATSGLKKVSQKPFPTWTWQKHASPTGAISLRHQYLCTASRA
ncbi:unnamed protein product [Zymoseptoria tritici ST99CH_1A5]|uniref:Uncharacterized protein n=2 Tax=Zymoseptoria tritici TaxID=1047171 RepID=A0A2H1H9A3_ZYMTR|nr:unnamed protein product [Zymoseptoria tritici ST99CH_1E4]SMY30243.1 unnamed protein product [Zymoseptoria tritici ST99CH_1A5]